MANGPAAPWPEPRRLYEGLPLVYLVVCVPFGLVYCFLVPPMLVPDEWAHFFRTVQIAYGDVIGEKPEGQKPGGQVPQSLTTFLADPRFTKRLPTKKAATSRVDGERPPPEVSRLRFEDETTFHVCPFVRYPPSSYLFGAGAVRLGRAWRLDTVSIFYLARIITFVTSAFMSWLALQWMSSSRLFAFLMLSMPMMLSLFGSCSQDAALIAFAALVVGFVQRFLMTTSAAGQWTLPKPLFMAALAASAAMGAIAAGRPPYLPLVGVVPLFFVTATRRWRQAAILAGVGIAVPVAWLWMTRGLGSGNEFGADHAGQVQFIVTHPWQSLAVFLRSVSTYLSTSSWLRHIVSERPTGGPLPLSIYRAAGAAFLVALARDAWRSDNRTPLVTRLLVMLLLFGAFFALHLAGYIYFTPVGANTVNGIQGRYLVPLLLVLPLVIGTGRSATSLPDDATPAANANKAACIFDIAAFSISIGVVVLSNICSAINMMRIFYYP